MSANPASSTAALICSRVTFDSSTATVAAPTVTALISSPGIFPSSFFTDITQCWQLIPGVVLVASWNEDDALVTYSLPVVDATLFPFELGAVRREQRLALTYGQA